MKTTCERRQNSLPQARELGPGQQPAGKRTKELPYASSLPSDKDDESVSDSLEKLEKPLRTCLQIHASLTIKQKKPLRTCLQIHASLTRKRKTQGHALKKDKHAGHTEVLSLTSSPYSIIGLTIGIQSRCYSSQKLTISFGLRPSYPQLPKRMKFYFFKAH